MTTKMISDVNLYDLLGTECEAQQVEIRRAYRKKALECHPDKNPDNPKAAELFHELSKALEILTDATARAAYDKVLKAKKATELRNKQLDGKRQKLKSELEQREREAYNKLYSAQPYTTVRKTDEEILQDQIERLRREGSKLLEEEQKLMREQLQKSMKELKKIPAFNSTQHRIKIKWKCNKEDMSNSGYTKEILLKYLMKYGDVVAFVMSKKPGSALVEFNTLEAAEMALTYEKGMLENSLRMEWVTPQQPKVTESVTNAELDFEDLVLRKLRQAEERKRLIDQIQKEDEQDI